MEILGIDVGGSGMKAGIVNIETGEMISETPSHSLPLSQEHQRQWPMSLPNLLKHFDYKG